MTISADDMRLEALADALQESDQTRAYVWLFNGQPLVRVSDSDYAGITLRVGISADGRHFVNLDSPRGQIIAPVADVDAACTRTLDILKGLFG